MPERTSASAPPPALLLRGIRYATGPHSVVRGSIKTADGKIARLLRDDFGARMSIAKDSELDLHGFLLMPGLINAHDHLQYGLYPRLGNPPYRNYVEWGEDIHKTLFATIALYKSVPQKTRLWWGGLRNLLCGVTTVCHHNPLWLTLRQSDYPVKVVQDFAWAHSLVLGSDLRDAYLATPATGPFIMHACEGTDELAREELMDLDRLGLLEPRTVLVHGLALDTAGIELLRKRQTALIVCLSSNQFLYGQIPDMTRFSNFRDVALGNDSPLTAAGDLLDEARFAMEHAGIAPHHAYRMITELPASILRLSHGEGQIRESASADLIAIRDTGDPPETRLQDLSWKDIELVMVAGRIQLASEEIWGSLPERIRQGMEPLWIDGKVRWLRAPVEELLREAADVLGESALRLGGRTMKSPRTMSATHDIGLKRSPLSFGRGR